MRRPCGKVHRLDLLVLGANPEKLAARREAPASNGPRPLSDAEKLKFYQLTWREQFPNTHNSPALSPTERWELQQLRERAKLTTPAGKGWF
jgi:hypothetical protein